MYLVYLNSRKLPTHAFCAAAGAGVGVAAATIAAGAAAARAVAAGAGAGAGAGTSKGIGDGDLPGEYLFRTQQKKTCSASKPEAVYLTVYPLCIQTECGFTCILCVQTPSGVCLTPRTKSSSAPKVTGDAYDYYQRARNPNKV